MMLPMPKEKDQRYHDTASAKKKSSIIITRPVTKGIGLRYYDLANANGKDQCYHDATSDKGVWLEISSHG